METEVQIPAPAMVCYACICGGILHPHSATIQIWNNGNVNLYIRQAEFDTQIPEFDTQIPEFDTQILEFDTQIPEFDTWIRQESKLAPLSNI